MTQETENRREKNERTHVLYARKFDNGQMMKTNLLLIRDGFGRRRPFGDNVDNVDV